jgi:hypothetical protein
MKKIFKTTIKPLPLAVTFFLKISPKGHPFSKETLERRLCQPYCYHRQGGDIWGKRSAKATFKS